MPLSSPIQIESDPGFTGMASRLNPINLPPGMVQLAINMRLDRGEATHRKGAKKMAAGISPGQVPLTLDFLLGTDFQIVSITRSGSTATVTTALHHGANATDVVSISGADQSSYNGDFAVVSVISPTSFTITVSGSPVTPATSAGNNLIVNVGGPIIQDNYTGGIFAAGIYSSPRLDNANEYVVLCGPSAAYLWRYGSGIVTKAFPSSAISEQILEGDQITLLQAFDKLYLHRWRAETEFKLVSLSNSYVVTAGISGTTCTLSGTGLPIVDGKNITLSSMNAALGTFTALPGANSTTITYTVPSGTTAPSGTLALTSGSTSYSVTASISGTTCTLSGTGLPVVAGGSFSVSSTNAALGTFTALPGGSSTTIAYIVPSGTSVPTGPLSVGTTIATATTPSAHGYSVGEVARISGASQAGYNAEQLIASVPSNTTFTFLCASTLIAESAVVIARRVCAPLVWDGGTGNFVRVALGVDPLGATYSLMASSPAATYFNNQVASIYGRDQVRISDVLNAENNDPLLKSFRANTGSNDYLVGIHPYADSQLIVAGRKSLYIALIVIASDGVSIDPANSSLKLLTSEIGCNAPKTMVTAGSFIYFLSDNGVYRLDNSQIDAALRGNTKPLSDAIADQFALINADAVSTSHAVCFNNRFWLAIPTVLGDGSPATSPNTLLVYNMLNEAWESSDTYDFDLNSLVVTDYGTERRLFATSRTGLIYLLDESDDGADDQAGGIGTTYQPGELLLRRYTFGLLTRKRLLRMIASIDLPAHAGCAFDAVTINPNDNFQISSLTSSKNLEENYTVKGPIRRRANLMDLRWRTTAGRPVLRAVTAEAAMNPMPLSGSRTES